MKEINLKDHIRCWSLILDDKGLTCWSRKQRNYCLTYWINCNPKPKPAVVPSWKLPLEMRYCYIKENDFLTFRVNSSRHQFCYRHKHGNYINLRDIYEKHPNQFIDESKGMKFGVCFNSKVNNEIELTLYRQFSTKV